MYSLRQFLFFSQLNVVLLAFLRLQHIQADSSILDRQAQRQSANRSGPFSAVVPRQQPDPVEMSRENVLDRTLLKFHRLLVTNCFCLALYAQTITGLNPLTATVNLVNSKVKAGQPVTLVVALKNTSQQSVVIVHTNPLRDYQIDLRNSKGVQVERTPHGKSMLHPPDIIGRIVKKTLLPGESVREELELDLAFLLTTPGTYSVSVSRIVSDANNRAKTFIATAPVVSFTIEP